MERIFDGIGSGTGLSSDEELDYQVRVRAMIEDARWFNQEWLAPDRELATRYYHGQEPYLDEEGRSTIVSTEVRDTVMDILPSLIRIFTSAEKVIEYVPRREDAVELAEEATDYVNYVFWDDNDGFMLMHAALKDALIRNTGIFHWWTDNNIEIVEKHYQNISQEQAQYIIHSHPDCEVVEEEPDEERGGTLAEFRIKIRKDRPMTKVEAVPPDEFRIDRNAKSFKSARLLGRECRKPVSELILKGYDQETVESYMNSGLNHTIWSEERILRNPGLSMEGTGIDPADGDVLYGEYFIRIDQDGDGIAELRYICTMGDECEIVCDEVVDRIKMASICPDPEPHTAIGHSISELITDIQKIKTAILRNSLDSLAQSIFPRVVVNEQITNISDVLNQEVGAPIRTKGDVNAAVKQLENIFVGEPAFKMIGYLDETKVRRTGVSEASKGIDPKALQSTNVKGIDMLVTGAQERIELIARIIAETGFKEMFKGLLREITENPNPDRTVKLRGKFVQPRVDAYDPNMDVKVNPSMGRGSDMDRLVVLTQVKATQEMIIQNYGIGNPMVGIREYRNTIADMLAIGNVRNVGRYFKEVTEDQEKQLIEATQNKKDPATMIAEAEIEKIRATTAKAVGDLDHKNTKLQLDEDFRRDKMETDASVQLAKIGADTQNVETVESIRAINNLDRDSAKLQHQSKENEAGRTHDLVKTEHQGQISAKADDRKLDHDLVRGEQGAQHAAASDARKTTTE